MNLGRGSKAVLVVAAIVVALAGVKLAAPILVPFLLAAFIAIISAPLVVWLVNKGVPSFMAVFFAILLDVGGLVALGLVVGVSLNSFSERLPHYEEKLIQSVDSAEAWLETRGVNTDVLEAIREIRNREQELNPTEESLVAGVNSPTADPTTDIQPAVGPVRQSPESALSSIVNPGSVMGIVAAFLKSIAQVVSNLVLVVVFVIFMLAEAVGMKHKLRNILHDPEAELGNYNKATREVQKYLLVKTLSSVVTGAVITGWVAALGLDFPLLWGLIAFLLNFVPTIGSIIAAIPAVIIALIQFGPGTALAVSLGYFVVNFGIGTFIEPRVLGRALGLSPLVVVLSVILWGWLLGPVGALLSVPLTMGLKIFLLNTQDAKWLAVLLGPARAPFEGDSSVDDLSAKFPRGTRALDTLPPP